MIALIAAEFLKLRTTRTFWWLAFAAIALSALFTVGQLASEDIVDESDLRLLLSNITAASILVIVLGVVGSAGEYRHGTITSTFLVAPDRTRVQLAKGIAYGIAGVAIGTATAALVLAIALPWLSSDGMTLSELGVGSGELAGILAGALALSFLSGAFGVAIGSLVPNQLGAVMVIVVLIFILDPVLVDLFNTYTKFSRSGLATSLGGASAEDSGLEGDLLAPGVSALIFLGYTAALLGAAAAATHRRDVA